MWDQDKLRLVTGFESVFMCVFVCVCVFQPQSADDSVLLLSYKAKARGGARLMH